MSRRLARLWCALRGHNAMLCFAPPRMLLRCESCGYESPGWDTSLRRSA